MTDDLNGMPNYERVDCGKLIFVASELNQLFSGIGLRLITAFGENRCWTMPSHATVSIIGGTDYFPSTRRRNSKRELLFGASGLTSARFAERLQGLQLSFVLRRPDTTFASFANRKLTPFDHAAVNFAADTPLNCTLHAVDRTFSDDILLLVSEGSDTHVNAASSCSKTITEILKPGTNNYLSPGTDAADKNPGSNMPDDDSRTMKLIWKLFTPVGDQTSPSSTIERRVDSLFSQQDVSRKHSQHSQRVQISGFDEKQAGSSTRALQSQPKHSGSARTKMADILTDIVDGKTARLAMSSPHPLTEDEAFAQMDQEKDLFGRDLVGKGDRHSICPVCGACRAFKLMNKHISECLIKLSKTSGTGESGGSLPRVNSFSNTSLITAVRNTTTQIPSVIGDRVNNMPILLQQQFADRDGSGKSRPPFTGIFEPVRLSPTKYEDEATGADTQHASSSSYFGRFSSSPNSRSSAARQTVQFSGGLPQNSGTTRAHSTRSSSRAIRQTTSSSPPRQPTTSSLLSNSHSKRMRPSDLSTSPSSAMPTLPKTAGSFFGASTTNSSSGSRLGSRSSSGRRAAAVAAEKIRDCSLVAGGASHSSGTATGHFFYSRHPANDVGNFVVTGNHFGIRGNGRSTHLTHAGKLQNAKEELSEFSSSAAANADDSGCTLTPAPRGFLHDAATSANRL